MSLTHLLDDRNNCFSKLFLGVDFLWKYQILTDCPELSANQLFFFLPLWRINMFLLPIETLTWWGAIETIVCVWDLGLQPDNSWAHCLMWAHHWYGYCGCWTGLQPEKPERGHRGSDFIWLWLYLWAINANNFSYQFHMVVVFLFFCF